MLRQWLNTSVFILTTLLLLSACSEAPTPELSGETRFAAGTHYSVLEYPVQQGNSAPFLVEYIWVGCPSCQRFEPIMQAFKHQHPDVAVVRKHGALSERWVADGSIFHALERVAGRDIAPEMLAFYASKIPSLPDAEDLAGFIESLGLTPEDVFNEASSIEVARTLEANFNDMLRNNIRGVPSVVVNGRYLLANPLPADITTNEDLFALINELLSRD